MNRKILTLTGLTAIVLAGIAYSLTADNSKMDHSKMDMPMEAAASDTASSKAFIEANARMHSDMAVKYSGDADIDFVKGMVPHHTGAVEMAKIVLQYGKDPEVKKLAEDVIKAQTSEIAWMNDGLAKHAK